MSSRYIDPQFTRLAALENLFNRYVYTPQQTSMANGSFNNCDFTWADLTEVDARSASFNNVIGVNLNAHGIDIREAQANDSIFTGSHFDHIKAHRLEAQDSDFTRTSSQRGKFSYSNLAGSDFSHSNTSNSVFDNSDLRATNFFRTKTKATHFKTCQLDGAKLPTHDFKISDRTSIIEADISNVQPDEISVDNITGSPIHDLTASQLQTQAITKKMHHNELRTRVKYSFFIIGSIALIAIGGPITIAHLAPALISSSAVQSIINTAALTIFSITADSVSERMLGTSAGINKFMSNFLGAGKDIENLNNNLFIEQTAIKKEVKAITTTRKKVQEYEREIKKVTKERQTIKTPTITMAKKELSRRNTKPQQLQRGS